MESEERRLNGVLTVREFERMMAECRRADDQWRRDHMKAHDLEAKAAEMAQRVTHERLEKLNELRTEVLTDRNLFLRQDIYDREHKPIVAAVSEIRDAQSRLESRIQLLIVLTPMFLLAIGTMIGVLEFVHK